MHEQLAPEGFHDLAKCVLIPSLRPREQLGVHSSIVALLAQLTVRQISVSGPSCPRTGSVSGRATAAMLANTSSRSAGSAQERYRVSQRYFHFAQERNMAPAS